MSQVDELAGLCLLLGVAVCLFSCKQTADSGCVGDAFVMSLHYHKTVLTSIDQC